MIRIEYLSRKKGFTLIEVLVSFMLIAIAFLSFEVIMYTQQYFISYSKHKLQAIHAAQAVLGIQRATAYPTGNPPAVSPPAYPGCDLPGAIVTVSFLPPYNDSTCYYRTTVQVKVSWTENMCGVPVTRQEFLTTDIAKEPQLN